jgi:lariat debranching enzyme
VCAELSRPSGLTCGELIQAIRNEHDLNCMSVPRRYRHLGDFHKYYSGQSRAPVLTIVIGGNHEASNYLFELHHGGWLAPNIYYLGAAGVIRYGPWRIAGLSGIYDKRDYRKPHHERLPYDRESIKSVYHVREYDVRKLLSVSGGVDVCLSHDWPAWVELFGDYEDLYASKPLFHESAKKDGLGSKPATQILDHLRPAYWFSGHMHIRFEANVQHTQASIDETIRKLDVSRALRSELPVFDKGYKASLTLATPGVEKSMNATTKFLALGKVGQDPDNYLNLLEVDLPRCPEHAQYLERTRDDKYHIYYDEEWLAITRAYNDSLLLTNPETLVVPPSSRQNTPRITAETIADHETWVRENVTAKGLLRIPQNFVAHAPFRSAEMAGTEEQPLEYPNVQTSAFAELLQMQNKFEIEEAGSTSEGESDGIEFG